MKTTKPEWTATNEEGGKLFYFKELGWVNANTGLVTPDPVPDCFVQPEGATHIQIHKGRVNFLRRNCNATGFSMLNGDHWLCVGFELSGHIIRLEGGVCDGINPQPVPNSVGNPWFEHKGGCAPDTIGSRRVEVQLFAGHTEKGCAGDFRWVWPSRSVDDVPMPSNVCRWRYA